MGQRQGQDKGEAVRVRVRVRVAAAPGVRTRTRGRVFYSVAHIQPLYLRVRVRVGFRGAGCFTL